MSDIPFRVHISDNRELHILTFASDASKLIDFMTMKKSRLNTSEHSYRILNHWTKLGIIDEQRENEKGWRKFSLIEIVWLEIVKELRNFGLSNDKILKVKNTIQNDFYSRPSTISDTLIFQYYLGIAFAQKVSSFLLVFKDGNACFTTYSDLTTSEILRQTPNHIRLSLNSILSKIFPEKNFKPINDRHFQLSRDELDLLYELRVNNVESIKIHSKEGEIKYLEIEEKTSDKTIFEVLKEGDYQDLEIKQRDGKVVTIKRTKRIKKAKK